MIENSTFTKKIPIAAIAFILIVPLALNESFAMEEYEGVVWQLVYLKANICHPTDEQVAKMYGDLTREYLGLYQVENKAIELNCMTELEFENFMTDESANLMILIYDEELGEKFLKANDLDGIYAHVGTDRLRNHTLVVCDCTDGQVSFESALTPWVLSHELSHFVLSYKGFNKSAIKNAIHSVEKEYDECVAEFTINSDCGGVKLTIKVDNGARNFAVMNPYEPAVGNGLIKFLPDMLDSTGLDLHRELVSLWLVGSINDNAYMSTVKHLVDPPVENNIDTSYPDLIIPNGFVIYEVVKNKEIDWQELLNPTNSETELDSLLNYISFSATETNQNFDENEFPNWFKTRALLWSEKRISDKVFFDGIEHLVRAGTITIS